jgi:Arc/MetJ family transcription regulator
MRLCYYAIKGDRIMRTTITINDKLFRALKIRAAETDKSISQLVESAVKYQVLEDFEDIEDATKREHESTYSFDDLVKQFKAEGLL